MSETPKPSAQDVQAHTFSNNPDAHAPHPINTIGLKPGKGFLAERHSIRPQVILTIPDSLQSSDLTHSDKPDAHAEE